MTSFETEVYNRSSDDVIGARVVVSANNGQQIDSIQVTNKTQFDELKAKLDVLDESYVEFADGSSLAGRSLDSILQNTSENATINATKLGGYQSDQYSKTGHTHGKSSITDLYNYNISLSNYNPIINDNISVTVKVTNSSGAIVTNHPVNIYKNGSLWKTLVTNSNGVVSVTYPCDSFGLVTFAVDNQKVQCNVTGFKKVSAASFTEKGVTVAVYENKDYVYLVFDGSIAQNVNDTGASGRYTMGNRIPVPYCPLNAIVVETHNGATTHKAYVTGVGVITVFHSTVASTSVGGCVMYPKKSVIKS